jgi:HAD superfamily hydrolase (TIGR01509 family)
MRFADLDAVTIDAYKTIVGLVDPVPALEAALREQGVQRSRDAIQAAFDAEGRYYREHLHEGAGESSLRDLHTRCAGVFLDAAGAELDAREFAPTYIACLRFKVLDGVEETLLALHSRGLELAVVANWDISVHDHLDALGLTHFFSIVVATARKPSPDRLLETLARLEVDPARALHVGDEEADERAAAAAGVHHLPAPLADAVAELA